MFLKAGFYLGLCKQMSREHFQQVNHTLECIQWFKGWQKTNTGCV